MIVRPAVGVEHSSRPVETKTLALGEEQMTILLHEMGHTFGLNDCKCCNAKSSKRSVLTSSQSMVRRPLASRLPLREH